MAIHIDNIEPLIQRLDKIADASKIEGAMKICCAKVERSAKQKAHTIRDTGQLANSITSKVERDGNDVVGIVFTPKEYAPYVEYGTGMYAEEGGRSGYWVYVKDSTSDGKKTKKKAKTYTLEEAKKIMAILRSKGLEAYYTCGQKPQPYMRPALNENREKILKILEESVKND